MSFWPGSLKTCQSRTRAGPPKFAKSRVACNLTVPSFCAKWPPSGWWNRTIRFEHVMLKNILSFVVVLDSKTARPGQLSSQPNLTSKHTCTTAKMMTAITLLLAPLTFVHAMSTPNVITGLGAANKVSNATGATCGVGYTYCGYILQEEKRTFPCALLHSNYG